MERKNIFQRIEENYNIDDEIRKIHQLFEEKKYFYRHYNAYGRKTIEKSFTFVEMLESYIFDSWKHRGTCISIKELLERANAQLPSHPSFKIEEETAINYIEVILNLIKLYRDKIRVLNIQCIDCYQDFKDVFCPLVETLKKHLGLSERIIDGAIIVYPENAPLEEVLNITPDENAQWELIRYSRETLLLAEKRKMLAYFATAFYIESDKNDDEATKSVVEKATNILNNLHIRHNNEIGKYEKDYLKDISEDEAVSLCDLLYKQILTIVLLREQKKYDKVYKDFKDKQKGQKP